LPVQPSNRYLMVQMDFLAANHNAYCLIVRSELKPEVVVATIILHLHPYSFEWAE